MITFPIAFFKGASAAAFDNTYSIDFDGVNDYVTMGNILDQDGSDAFTISAWDNVDDLTNYRAIVAKQNSSSPQVGFSVYVRQSTGRISFQLKNSSGTGWHIQTTDNTLSVDTWYHVAVTYDGSKNSTGCEIYVNATACTISGSGSFTGSSSSTDDFQIGKRGGNLLMSGMVDEVAFFDAELSASDISGLYNSGVPADLTGESNLVGWWRMGDGDTHPTLSDNSTNSNDGTMTNMASDDIVEDTP